MPAFTTSIPCSTEFQPEQYGKKKTQSHRLETQIRKEEVKFPLFADDVILYVANAEDSRKKKKKTVRKKYRKVGGCRLTHKNQLHLHALTD